MSRDTVVAAAPDELWAVVDDPEQLPRWWPGVTRVEEASPEAWTTVLASARGKVVRADYSRVGAVAGQRIEWRQEIAGSPFERILASAVTAVELSAAESGATRVQITLEQTPRGWARFAPMQFRSAASRQVKDALDGLRALFEGPES